MTVPTHPAVSDAMREAVARDPRVDTQVWTAAATLSPEQTQQPEWLWFANDGTEGIPVARYSFGRWPKIGGAAPYVRADIPLSGPIASEIARLTGENARLKADREERLAEPCICQWQARAEAAEAEIARLRAALERLADFTSFEGKGPMHCHQNAECLARINFARAALTSQEKTDA